MASKKDVRPVITLACTECKERNYTSQKNRRNDPGRMELQKYEPGVVRITEMILNVSEVVETQAYVSRLKESLRGLGLLL